jgi:hypothetical protein
VAYASWNGATDVASWRVLAGVTSDSLAPVATSPRTGFETAIALPPSVVHVRAERSYAQLQALDPSGAVIGVSALVRY